MLGKNYIKAYSQGRFGEAQDILYNAKERRNDFLKEKNGEGHVIKFEDGWYSGSGRPLYEESPQNNPVSSNL